MAYIRRLFARSQTVSANDVSPQRRLFGQFIALFSGNVAAQIFNLASYPLLGRLYDPAAFGVFSTFIAASAIPGAIACGRFELAIAIAPRAGCQAMLWLCYFTACIVAVGATLGFGWWWWTMQIPDLTAMMILLFVAVVLTGVVNATTMFLMRHESFRFASTGIVVRTATAVIMQVSLAAVSRSPMMLIGGFVAGLIAQSVVNYVFIARTYRVDPPQFRRIRALFRRFRRQVSIDIPSTLLAALSINLMPFLLQSQFGLRSVGYYSVGQRIAVLPLQLLNDAMSQIYYQRAARAQEKRGDFWAETRTTALISTAVSAGALIVIWCSSRWAITIFLGPNWEPAADILIWLAPMLAIRGIALSLGTAVFVLRRPQWLLLHNVFNVLFTVSAFGISLHNKLGIGAFTIVYAGLTGLEYFLFAAAVLIAVRKNGALGR